MKRGKSILRLILICVFTGCIGASVVAYSVYQQLQRGWNNTPLPTMRAYSAKDIVGTWTYSDPSGLAVVTITFDQNGTFDQKVSLGGAAPRQQRGQWSIPSGTNQFSIQGARPGAMNLHLEGVLVDNGRGWRPQEYVGWDIVDSDLRPGELAIAGGGNTDPDTFSEFKKLNVNGGATTARASMPSD